MVQILIEAVRFGFHVFDLLKYKIKCKEIYNNM